MFVFSDRLLQRVEKGDVSFDWAEKIVISADRMREIFDVIKASGPTDDIK